MHSDDLNQKKLEVNSGQAHRNDCFIGNNIRFILHHFPIIVADITYIHDFWKEKHYITNENEEIVFKILRDIVKNFHQVNEQLICR